jgi:hypothetical protein
MGLQTLLFDCKQLPPCSDSYEQCMITNNPRAQTGHRFVGRSSFKAQQTVSTKKSLQICLLCTPDLQVNTKMLTEKNEKPRLPNAISIGINQHGAVLTQAQRESIAETKGICVMCGLKTHQVTLLNSKPLRNEDIYQGICIRDNPLRVPAYVYRAWKSNFQPNNQAHCHPLPAVTMKKSPTSLASIASKFPLEDPNIAQLPHDEIYGKNTYEEERIVPTQSPLLGDILMPVTMKKSPSLTSIVSKFLSEELNKAQIPRSKIYGKILCKESIVPMQSPMLGHIGDHKEAISGANWRCSAPNSQILPGAIQVGNEDHVDENYLLSSMIADQNVPVAPATTLVEAERVDLVYGVAEAVHAHNDSSLVVTAAGASEQDQLVNMICSVSKRSLRIIVGMVLLLIVTIIVSATVGVLSQNKSSRSSTLAIGTTSNTAPFVIPSNLPLVSSSSPSVHTLGAVNVTTASTTQPPFTHIPTPLSSLSTQKETFASETLSPTRQPHSPMPPLEPDDGLQIICQWMDLSPTMCPTVYSAYPPRATATGTIPTQIGLLTSLMDLSLVFLSLSGTIPTQIGLPMFLTGFVLKLNDLTGPIPSQIGLLTSLKNLFLRTIHCLSKSQHKLNN